VNERSDTLKGIECMKLTYRRHMETYIIAVTYTFEMGGGEKRNYGFYF